MAESQIVVTFRGGGYIYISGSQEEMGKASEDLYSLMVEYAKTGEKSMYWTRSATSPRTSAVCISDVVGFYVRDIPDTPAVDPRHYERQVAAMERLAKAAEKEIGRGEDWKGCDDA